MEDDFRTRSNGKHRDYRRSHRQVIPINRDEDYYLRLSVKEPKGWKGHPNFSFRYIDRWLHKHLGQQWNKLFSEICEEYPLHTVKGQEVRKYLNYHIDHRCFIDEEGTIRTFQGYRGDPGQCDYFPLAHDYFVHPVSDILMYRKVDNPSRWKPKESLKIEYIQLQDGAWYSLLECSPNKGPLYKFKAWFYCFEEKSTQTNFDRIKDYVLTQIQNMITPGYKGYVDSSYIGKPLNEVLLMKGYVQELRKGEYVWGKYVTHTDTKIIKRFCNKEENTWIEKYIQERVK